MNSYAVTLFILAAIRMVIGLFCLGAGSKTLITKPTTYGKRGALIIFLGLVDTLLLLGALNYFN